MHGLMNIPSFQAPSRRILGQTAENDDDENPFLEENELDAASDEQQDEEEEENGEGEADDDRAPDHV